MKREEFKTMVKEIVREVMDEVNEGQNQYPQDDPKGLPGGMTSKSKMNQRSSDARAWAEKAAALKALKNEPGFRDKQKTLRQNYGDAPLTHRTQGQGTTW